MYSASQGGKKAQENFNILNADLTEFLDDLEKTQGTHFLFANQRIMTMTNCFIKR